MYEMQPGMSKTRSRVDDEDSDGGMKKTDFNKLDYSLPVTASEVFRANFIVNKTFRQKKNVQ